MTLPKLFADLKTIDPNSHVFFCKKCIMSNQRPRLQFNEEGVCSSCLFSEYKNTLVDWDKREKELEELCDKHRKEDGSWDVLVPASGGKDGGYVAYILKTKFGMNPLIATYGGALPTEIGEKNLSNLNKSGFPGIILNPDHTIHKKFSRISLIEFGDNFIPFTYGQINFPLQISVKFKIPFIMYGENGDLEYGGGPIEKYNIPTLDIHTNDVSKKLDGLPCQFASQLAPDQWKPDDISQEDLLHYYPPTQNELTALDVKEYFFSYFENWKPEAHLKIAQKHLNFQVLPERSEGTYTNFASLDDKTDGLHYYMMFIKQGLGRTTSDATHQIRDEILTRDEGVDLVQKYDGEFPEKYMNETLDYLSLSSDELNKIFDKFRSSLIWEKSNQNWELKNQVKKL